MSDKTTYRTIIEGLMFGGFENIDLPTDRVDFHQLTVEEIQTIISLKFRQGGVGNSIFRLLRSLHHGCRRHHRVYSARVRRLSGLGRIHRNPRVYRPDTTPAPGELRCVTSHVSLERGRGRRFARGGVDLKRRGNVLLAERLLDCRVAGSVARALRLALS